MLTILLLFMYSFSSIGATVKAHLCAGKVQKCFCGKSTKNKDTKKDTCCSEKTTFIKKQDLHQASEVAVAKQSLFLANKPVDFYTILVPSVIEAEASNMGYSKIGRLFTGPPIYALDCLYLI